jgi:hypothetical protein
MIIVAAATTKLIYLTVRSYLVCQAGRIAELGLWFGSYGEPGCEVSGVSDVEIDLKRIKIDLCQYSTPLMNKACYY